MILISKRSFLFVLTLPLIAVFGLGMAGASSASSGYGTSAPSSKAADPFLLGDDKKSYDASAHMDYLVDKQRKWSIEDIQPSGQANHLFQPTSGKSFFGFSSGVYWLRMEIRNDSTDVRWVIRMLNPLFPDVKIYASNQVLTSLKDHNWSFAFNLPRGQSTTLYIRSATNGMVLIPHSLMKQSVYENKQRDEYLMFGLYYGIVLLMIVYLLSLYVTIRDTSYLYYALVAFFYGCMAQFIWNGLGLEFFNDRFLTEPMAFFFIMAAFWFGFLFLRKIFQPDKYAPPMNIAIRYIIVLCPILAIASITFDFPSIEPWMIVFMLAAGVTVLVTGIWSQMQGNRSARYINMGMLFSLLLGGLTALMMLGLVPDHPLAHFGMQIGNVAELMFFSFALSDWMKQYREQQEAAQRQLVMSQMEQKVRSELLENITHDIRSPLTIIQGGIQKLMHHSTQDAERQATLGKIYKRVLDVNRFIDDLFELSSHDAESVEDDMEAVVIREWLEEEFSLFAAEIESAELCCKVQLTALHETLEVWINPHRIKRVLANLVNNALKFSPKGGTIELAAFQQDKDVVIQITDNGRGIRQSELFSVFQRKFRGNQSGEMQGSGLGLAIAQEIIGQHGGRIWAESEQCKGSMFSLALPILDDPY